MLKKLAILGFRILGRVKRAIFRILPRNGFCLYIYGALLDLSFYREIRGVYDGQKKYLSDVDGEESSEFLLRRNTHRLEKGLLMRPRRDVFARDYILETVQAYKKAVSSPSCADIRNFSWYQNVLSEYFSVVSAENPTIAKAKEIFLSAQEINVVENERLIPYRWDSRPTPDVSFEDFHYLAKFRRSVRWYQDKKVPRELIDQAVEIAGLSPSACNRQPFEFYIVDDPDKAKKIGAIPGGTTGFSHNFPGIAVVVGKLDAYPFPRDRHLIYIDGSLAAMSFMYALETMGIASCPINWPDVTHSEKKMAKRLGLKPYERPVMLISFGYADPEGLVAYSSKKPLEKLRRYI